MKCIHFLRKGILFLILIITLLIGARVNAQDALGPLVAKATNNNEAVGPEFISGSTRLGDDELNLIMGRMLVANTPNGDYYDAKIILWDEWKMKDFLNQVQDQINQGPMGIGNHSSNTLSFKTGGK